MCLSTEELACVTRLGNRGKGSDQAEEVGPDAFGLPTLVTSSGGKNARLQWRLQVEVQALPTTWPRTYSHMWTQVSQF